MDKKVGICSEIISFNYEFFCIQLFVYVQIRRKTWHKKYLSCIQWINTSYGKLFASFLLFSYKTLSKTMTFINDKGVQLQIDFNGIEQI